MKKTTLLTAALAGLFVANLSVGAFAQDTAGNADAKDQNAVEAKKAKEKKCKSGKKVAHKKAAKEKKCSSKSGCKSEDKKTETK